MPPHVLNYWKADFVQTMSDGLIDAAVDIYSRAVSPRVIDPALSDPRRRHACRADGDRVSAPERHPHGHLRAVDRSSAERAEHRVGAAARGMQIQPFVPGGVYVNELGEDEGDDRVSLAYGENFARLAQIKAKYDPAEPVRVEREHSTSSDGLVGVRS